MTITKDRIQHYFTHHKEDWSEEFPGLSYTSIRVLPELTGKKIDDSTLSYISALRPSCLRISKGEVTCDAVLWRVTIIINDDEEIKEILQEVQVGLYPPLRNGYMLDHYTQTGKILDYPEPGQGWAIVNTRSVRVEQVKFPIKGVEND